MLRLGLQLERRLAFVTACLFMSTLSADAQQRPGTAGQAASPDGAVDRGQFSLHYTISGNGGPLIVVLAGGPGGDPSYLKPVVDRLSTRSLCLLLEQRGTGRSKLATYNEKTINFQSYLDDLEALRKHLNQPKLLLVGHSWGGMLALSYAGTYPDRVRAVISIDAGPIAEEHAIAGEANALRRIDRREQGRLLELDKRKSADPVGTFAEIQRATLGAYFYDVGKASTAATWLTGDSNLEVMRLGYEPAFGSLNAFIRARLHSIRAPVLLVHGRQDAVAEGGVVEAHQLIKSSRLAFIDKCGHLPWIEQPDELWKAVEAFITMARTQTK
jgi:proline iminopeptidase